MKITPHILTKNNESTIENTLNSLLGLGKAKILDVGSNDRTIDICKKYKCDIHQIEKFEDYSKSKNFLIKDFDGWILWVEPWEVLLSDVKDLNKNCSYYIQIIRDELITKEIRLWHADKKLFFRNPIFETIDDENACFYDGMLHSTPPNKIFEQTKMVEAWKNKHPQSIDAIYYYSCCLLSNKKYKEFISSASGYVFLDEKSISSIMIRYYLAMTQLYIFNNPQDAGRNILMCIANRPIMAEFWCLLGDIYYKIKQYTKALSLYENAIILGRRRLKSDLWPMEISKYDEYPRKMIKSCNEISEKIKNIQVH